MLSWERGLFSSSLGEKGTGCCRRWVQGVGPEARGELHSGEWSLHQAPQEDGKRRALHLRSILLKKFRTPVESWDKHRAHPSRRVFYKIPDLTKPWKTRKDQETVADQWGLRRDKGWAQRDVPSGVPEGKGDSGGETRGVGRKVRVWYFNFHVNFLVAIHLWQLHKMLTQEKLGEDYVGALCHFCIYLKSFQHKKFTLKEQKRERSSDQIPIT